MTISSQFMFSSLDVERELNFLNDEKEINKQAVKLFADLLVAYESVLKNDMCMEFLTFNNITHSVLTAFYKSSLYILNDYLSSNVNFRNFKYNNELFRMMSYKLCSAVYPETWFCHSNNLVFSKEFKSIYRFDEINNFNIINKNISLTAVPVEICDQLNANSP